MTEVTKGILVRVRAKEGKEADVEGFLQQGRSMVEEEPGTVRWFAISFGGGEYGVFDAFPDDDARQAHLQGEVGKALMASVGELIEEPTIEQVDIVAEKQPS